MKRKLLFVLLLVAVLTLSLLNGCDGCKKSGGGNDTNPADSTGYGWPDPNKGQGEWDNGKYWDGDNHKPGLVTGKIDQNAYYKVAGTYGNDAAASAAQAVLRDNRVNSIAVRGNKGISLVIGPEYNRQLAAKIQYPGRVVKGSEL